MRTRKGARIKMRSKKITFFIGLIVTILATLVAIFGFQGIKGAQKMRFGIDIRGGVEAVYTPVDLDRAPTSGELDSARTVIETRLDGKNILDREVTVDKDNGDIIVRFPWKSDEKEFNPEKAIAELGETAKLTFQDMDGNILVSGGDVDKAQAVKDTQNGRPVVSLTFNAAGTNKFAKATSKLVGQTLKIFMDTEEIFSGTVNEAITTGEAQISGLDSTDEAIALAQKINAGALPFSMETTNHSTISPKLGSGALDVMLKAGLIAFIIVCLFMLFNYRLSGFISCIALVFQMACQLLLLSAPQMTLTLPGMAGLILSLGMAVDANIIIAERIGEELRKGKSITSAIVEGYKNAFSAIFDGNLTTAIVAGILMIFGSGTMLSFGYTLLTGVILNFINVFFTRKLLLSIVDFKKLNNIKMFRIRKERKTMEFYKKRVIAYAFSIVILGIGLVLSLTKGISLDTGFVGGSILKYTYTGEINEDAISSAANTAVGRPATVQITTDIATDQQKLVLTLAGNKGLSPEEQTALQEAIYKASPNANLELSETFIVEPYIGERLLRKSAIAIALAFIFIIIYVWIRFSVISGLSAGLMALVALFHDVALVVTVFVIFGIPLNDAFVAITLTIIGYSINDTIILYDRIRENRKLDRETPLSQLVDESITQTFARSINTSATTTFCILVILIFAVLYGIESIRVFSLPMFFGLISGCYSSICIAGPLWVSWQNRKNKKGKKLDPSATA